MTRLLFVCMGNICRSPTAEGVMRALVQDAGLQDEIEVDSCGTGAWHAGEAPDARSTQAAAQRGIVLSGAARRIERSDFHAFDLLLCADADNARELREIAPEGTAEKIHLLREYDPASDPEDLDVPDPYYGGPSGFTDVLDLVQAACAGLLDDVRP